MIDLSKSRKGDRYEARDGEVWTYVRPTPNSRLCHDLTDQNGEVYGFCAYGAFWQAGLESDHDLLRALGPEPSSEEPAPEAGADATVEDWAQALKTIAENEESPALKTILVITAGQLEALSARIEALTTTNYELSDALAQAGYGLPGDTPAQIAKAIRDRIEALTRALEEAVAAARADEAQKAVDGTLNRVASMILRENRQQEWKDKQDALRDAGEPYFDWRAEPGARDWVNGGKADA